MDGVPIVLSSTPISDSLQQHLTDVLSQIPTGKSVAISGAVATTGATGSIAVKKSFGRFDLTTEGYAGKVWGGAGWDAGAKATFSF